MANKSIIISAVALMLSVDAQAAVTIMSYDITNAQTSGFGGWTHTYTGTITPTGFGKFNYSGGGGTLNDGFIPTSHIDNQLFSPGDNSTITLHLNTFSAIGTINIFGGETEYNSVPGTLTGATITIGGTSVAINSTPFGPTSVSNLCNDNFSLAGTSLADIATNTVSLSNFQGGWSQYYNIGEITVAAVPEPEEWAMMLMGFGLVGWQVNRKQGKIA